MGQNPQIEQEVPYRIDGRYRIADRIGSGSFATVYKAVNIINRRNYAIKLEKLTHGKASSLEQEAYVLEQLNQGSPIGIPRVHWFGRESNFDVIVLDLLGPSLQDIVKTRKTLSKVTVQHVGEELLSRFQYVHSRGYVHGDVQPQNILLGRGHSSTIFLVDFGLSKRYHHETSKCLPICGKRGFNGTPAFASINNHLGGELSCRDDLESFVYVLAYLLFGSLPWIQDRNQRKLSLSAVLRQKQSASFEQFCNTHHLPELSDMLLHTRMLTSDETPNYDFLRLLLQTTLSRRPNTTHSRRIIEEELQTPAFDAVDVTPACDHSVHRTRSRAYTSPLAVQCTVKATKTWKSCAQQVF